MANLTAAMAMIAVFALAVGGLHLIAKRRERTKGALMLACAAVILGNILIWTL
ncbi:hypothetical protein LZK98_10665 [Sphingomonas cannabina]|uniref:hypothetical protein n=1 Tax=Sphingomonas cannabina TaxID=2899123 RepID=UPI001F228770|nr:hypothetical protein [Sphingomonas cannabina]UIJ43562.1 hypothetical protein LZK98_10665 [Sphingomonas cannabina]